VAKKILKLVSETLRLDKLRNVMVDDVSLLNFDHKDDATNSSPVRPLVRVQYLVRLELADAFCHSAPQLQYGPPFAPLSFTSVPVESYPPQVCVCNWCIDVSDCPQLTPLLLISSIQVGEDVNLNRIHRLAAMYMWTKVYVVKHGRLLGVVNLDQSLNKVRGEEAPVLEAL
jgi:hypothetical protein